MGYNIHFPLLARLNPFSELKFIQNYDFKRFVVFDLS